MKSKFSLQLSNGSVDCYFSINRKAKKIFLKPQKDNTVKVVIPSGSAALQAKKFVNEKKQWIEDALKHLASIEYRFYFQGNEIKIDRYNVEDKRRVRFAFGNNILSIKANKEIETVYLYELWLKKIAKKVLPVMAVEISKKYGFHPSKIGVRQAKTRWGSCSAQNHISLNSRLMMCDDKIIEYVIIHELCHTVHHNHSKEFWTLVANYMPDFKTHYGRLKKIHMN